MFRTNDESSAHPHGIAGIGSEIHQHLIHLMAVGKDYQRFRCKTGGALNVLTDHPADEFFYPHYNLINIDGFLVTDLLATEQQ